MYLGPENFRGIVKNPLRGQPILRHERCGDESRGGYFAVVAGPDRERYFWGETIEAARGLADVARNAPDVAVHF